MKTQKRKTGDLGEAIAAKYLKNKGYLVIGRNYLKPYGEIDVIASKLGVIHFIEVKTVSCEIFDVKGSEVSRVTDKWNPAERVDGRKIKRLERVIGAYLLENRLDMEWQLDVCLVYLDEAKKKARVEFLDGQS